MIITHHYAIFFNHEKGLHVVKSRQTPTCPDCDSLLSGFLKQISRG